MGRIQYAPVVISAPTTLSVESCRRWAFGRVALLLSLLAIVSTAVGLVLSLSPLEPVLLLILASYLLLLPLLWLYPVMSVYLLIGAATLFESFRLYFPDSVTDRIPFFHSFSSFGGAVALPLTPAELLMVSALLIVMLKRIAARQKPLELGPLFAAVAFYTIMVIAGLVHGIGTGGNLNDALWEARAQLYLFFTYLLGFNLIRDQVHVKRLVWVFLIAVALKGLMGSFRYLVTLGGDLGRIHEFTKYNAILSHEESFFFALFLVFLVLVFLFRSDRAQLKFGLLFSLPVLLALLANQRRAGVLALFLGIFVAGLMAFVLVKSRRNLLLVLAVLVGLALPLYIGAMGQNTSLLAQPARAIASMYQPNERDQSSNDYREVEAVNLKYNVGIAPVLGRGYGKPMEMFVPMTDLSAHFTNWDLIPHNTILWVWMRLGFIGFVAFWFLIGRSLVGAVLIAKGVNDSYLRGVAVFCSAAIVAWVAQGAVDMGLADFRITILIGNFIAILSRLPEFQQQREALPQPT